MDILADSYISDCVDIIVHYRVDCKFHLMFLKPLQRQMYYSQDVGHRKVLMWESGELAFSSNFHC